MQVLYHKLNELYKDGKFINVAVVGAGFMGSSLISQLNLINGFKCNICYSRNNEKTKDVYLKMGVSDSNIKYIDSPTEYNNSSDNFYIMNDLYNFFGLEDIDVFVDATGDPYEGAKIAFEAIKHGKHIVSLNVECDVVVGSLLAEKAREKNVTYTGIAGDEPGTVKELYDFAKLLGFEVLAIGKGKNNPLDYEANYETVEKEANEKGIRPYMLASFVDGSKTMEELTLMCNATGFKPDVPGCHGIVSDIKNLDKNLKLKSEGGVLDSYNVCEYVMGIAPGVFVLVKAPNDFIDHEMRFLKVGDGPNYVLYRPFHLTSIEVPVTILQTYFFNLPTICPIPLKPVADTVAIAKKDLKPGDLLDGPGGKTIYGKIMTYSSSREMNYMPYGLASENVKVLREIKKGEPIKYDDVEIENSKLFELRKELELLTKSLK